MDHEPAWNSPNNVAFHCKSCRPVVQVNSKREKRRQNSTAWISVEPNDVPDAVVPDDRAHVTASDEREPPHVPGAQSNILNRVALDNVVKRELACAI